MGVLAGMTGFARVSGDAAWGSWAWEAKSVNGRGLDVRFNTPNGFEAIENELKTRLSKRFKRGSFQIALRIEFNGADGAASINIPLLQKLSDQVLTSTGEPLTPEAIATLLTMKGVVETDSQSLRDILDEQSNVDMLLRSGTEAFDALAVAREKEGVWLRDTFAQAGWRHETTRGDSARPCERPTAKPENPS